MKKLFLSILSVFSLQLAFCQYNSNVCTVTNSNYKIQTKSSLFTNQILDVDSSIHKPPQVFGKDYYKKKARGANKTGFILIGTGITMKILAESNCYVITSSSSYFDMSAFMSSVVQFFLQVLYPLPIAGSLYYFVNAREHKKKSKSILP